ncbi:hypothetical protein Dimus_026213, partial [Dionaea muscipula]
MPPRVRLLSSLLRAVRRRRCRRESPRTQSLQAAAICDLLLQLCDVVAIGRRAAVDERCP